MLRSLGCLPYHCGAKIDLELLILLPQLPECWDYTYVLPPSPGFSVLGVSPALASCTWASTPHTTKLSDLFADVGNACQLSFRADWMLLIACIFSPYQYTSWFGFFLCFFFHFIYFIFHPCQGQRSNPRQEVPSVCKTTEASLTRLFQKKVARA